MPAKLRSAVASTAWVRVRVTTAEEARLFTLASAAGLTVAAYVRRALFDMPPPSDDVPDYIRLDPRSNPFPPAIVLTKPAV